MPDVLKAWAVYRVIISVFSRHIYCLVAGQNYYYIKKQLKKIVIVASWIFLFTTRKMIIYSSNEKDTFSNQGYFNIFVLIILNLFWNIFIYSMI